MAGFEWFLGMSTRFVAIRGIRADNAADACTGFVRRKGAMNTTHEQTECGLTKLQRVVAALRALRADAELADRASTTAQLSRRNESALRKLYLAPRAGPEKVRAAPVDSSTSAGPRLEWIGQLGATAVAVCLLLVVVIVMVVPPA